MEQLVHRSNYEREVTREVLMKLAPVWSDNPFTLHIVVDCVQCLTMLMTMTFKAQMDGEHTADEGVFKLSVWIDRLQVFNVPKSRSPASLRDKLQPFVSTRS